MVSSSVIEAVSIFLNYLTPQKITFIDVRQEWKSWLSWIQSKEIDEIAWIESDSSRYLTLEKEIQKLDIPIHLSIQTIGLVAGEFPYYITSLNQENGLIQPNRLQKFWKNITERSKENRYVTSLKDYLAVDCDRQWLIIDSLNGYTLLKDSSLSLDGIDLVVVRVFLYPNLEQKDELTSKFETEGLILLDSYQSNHPEIVYKVYVRHYGRCCTELSDEYDILKQKHQQLNYQYNDLEVKHQNTACLLVEHLDTISKLGHLEEENRVLEKELAKYKRKYKTTRQLFSEFSKCIKDKESLLVDANKFSEDILGEVNAQQDVLQSLNNMMNNQLLLLNRFEENFNKNNVTPQVFSKANSNIINQLEHYIALNNYFNTGHKLSNYHGWPISPDIALFLVDCINENHYDAIIEFGSGTSTELFAKIARMRQQKNQKIPKILSFDHLPEYYEKTKAILGRENLNEFVQLECAPLIPMSLQGMDYQYYDCEQILRTFLLDLPDNAKILVLVDGPPGMTCKHARYPALPMIRKTLPDTCSMMIDLILDDSLRPEEKEVSMNWKKYLKNYGVRFIEKNFNNSEKGYLMFSHMVF